MTQDRLYTYPFTGLFEEHIFEEEDGYRWRFYRIPWFEVPEVLRPIVAEGEPWWWLPEPMAIAGYLYKHGGWQEVAGKPFMAHAHWQGVPFAYISLDSPPPDNFLPWGPAAEDPKDGMFQIEWLLAPTKKALEELIPVALEWNETQHDD